MRGTLGFENDVMYATTPEHIEMPDKEGLDVSEVTERLVGDLGYNAETVEEIVEDLQHMTLRIRAAFIRWWRGGRLEAPEVEGYSLQRLIEERALNPVSAFLTLDWLAQEPQEAKDALSRPWDEVR